MIRIKYSYQIEPGFNAVYELFFEDQDVTAGQLIDVVCVDSEVGVDWMDILIDCNGNQTDYTFSGSWEADALRKSVQCIWYDMIEAGFVPLI